MQISPWKFWKLNLKSDPRPFPASFRQRGAFSNNILVGYLVFITLPFMKILVMKPTGENKTAPHVLRRILTWKLPYKGPSLYFQMSRIDYLAWCWLANQLSEANSIYIFGRKSENPCGLWTMENTIEAKRKLKTIGNGHQLSHGGPWQWQILSSEHY